MRGIKVFFIVFSVIFITSTIIAQGDDLKPGVLTGNKVRVRTGPDTSHKILAELREGSKVNIVAQKGDWYEIEMPREIILWVSRNLIDQSTEDSGLTGVVNGDKVNVRTGIEATDVVVGQVNKGDKITIVGSREGWLKIRPPKGFTAYIYAKYVDAENVGETDLDPVVEPENGKSDTSDYDKTQERLEELKALNRKLEEEIGELEGRLNEKKKKEKELEEKLKKAEEKYEEYQKELERINEEYRRAIQQIEKGVEPKPKYTAEGIVDDIGKLLNAPPATHRLHITRGSEPRYYLVSADASINLDNYLRKRVGIEGEIVEKDWDGKKIEVIKVVSIAILED